jgi:hypothetical protein
MYITTQEALEMAEKIGAATTQQTIRYWCRAFGVGVKIGRTYKIDKEKFEEFLKGQKIPLLKSDKQSYEEAELPLCACGCGMKVSLPHNKYILGHSRYPYKGGKK